MKPSQVFVSIGVVLLLCACGDRAGGTAAAVAQTKFPGQVTAGGGTSGDVLARSAKPTTDGSSSGGTPFHAGGAEGNTGGASTAASASAAAGASAPAK